MTDDVLLEHARRLWATLAAAPVTVSTSAVEVAVSPRSSLCPPGWVGIVVVGNAAIATAPDGNAAELVRQALNSLPAAARTDPAGVCARLPIIETLGPATLAYCDTAGFRPGESGAVQTSPADHADLAALLARVPAEDAAEAGLDEITSPAFVVRSGPEIIAAAGYQAWPRDTAHLSVLTAPVARGRGLARVVAAAAVADALRAGLLPQWRARPAASRRVAEALGFRELGSQLSVRLTP
ncbi:GNAT family N-acetyltransferase [Actinoplanes sp. NPDC049668]|uniref:GNAT family N-acetyltransferase n=1 Tax=unclassified Actinoplanes TaxID=2626549 RepID=UPI00339DC6D3